MAALPDPDQARRLAAARAVLLSGSLLKRAVRSGTNYKRRHFVLRAGRHPQAKGLGYSRPGGTGDGSRGGVGWLAYYASAGAKVAKGWVELDRDLGSCVRVVDSLTLTFEVSAVGGGGGGAASGSSAAAAGGDRQLKERLTLSVSAESEEAM